MDELTPTSRSLEDLVDSENLAAVLDALVEVCSAKADHIRTNWQDDLLADTWEKAAGVICRAAAQKSVQRVSGL